MQDASNNLERTTVRKLMGHVVPLLAIGAVLQAFSQLNVAFAGLQMTKELGFSSAQFGFGSGIFFLSYLILGVPANLLLLKFGARRWIAFAMFCWGIFSAALALTETPMQFYVLRFLVGAAEAGFIPGMIYIAGKWFPEEYRGRVMSLLLMCNPIAAALAGPVSGLLLKMNGVAGLAGWQWIFIVEGLPASFLAFWVLKSLPSRAEDSTWLAPQERAWLVQHLHQERAGSHDPERFTASALIDSRVLALSVIFLGASSLPFGLIFFIPKIIESFGASAFQSSMLSALPFAAGAALMIWWGQRSDRRGERLYHALAGVAVALAGCVVYLVSSAPVAALLGLCMTFGGMYAFLPVFWTIPPRLLTGAVAATGIGVINGMGGVAGIVAPTVMGVFKDVTGTYETGLVGIMCAATLSSVVLLVYGRRRGLHRRAEATTP